jgi:hypothetical protein
VIRGQRGDWRHLRVDPFIRCQVIEEFPDALPIGTLRSWRQPKIAEEDLDRCIDREWGNRPTGRAAGFGFR